MEKGEAYWTYDHDVGAWYLGLKRCAKPPYTTQRHVEAILDLDGEGRLVGVEVLEGIEPSRGDHDRPQEKPKGLDETPAKDLTDEQITSERKRIGEIIDAGFGDHGGSPGEWYYERSDELDWAARGRGLI